MEIRFTQSFERDYSDLPAKVQALVDRRLLLLLQNFRHPSLQMKKMEGYQNVWEVRVTLGYRLTLSIVDNVYVIRRVGPHDILKKP